MQGPSLNPNLCQSIFFWTPGIWIADEKKTRLPNSLTYVRLLDCSSLGDRLIVWVLPEIGALKDRSIHQLIE